MRKGVIAQLLCGLTLGVVFSLSGSDDVAAVMLGVNITLAMIHNEIYRAKGE